MIDEVQRWRDRRSSKRPAGELIRTADYDVAEIATDSIAKRFVCAHHYSGRYPAARFRFGLYHGGELVGVAVYSQPVRDEVISNVFPGIERAAGAELGRFVLLDSVPGNGETWFLARTFELLRGRVAGVVSFADPMPRRALDGRLVVPGHVGTIYQAHNARYLGRGRADTLKLLPDGTAFSRRALSKIRAGERGMRAAVAQLVSHGAEQLADGACEIARRAWLATWLPRLTRELAHPGNHRYAWALDAKRWPRTLGPERQAPKQPDLEAACELARAA